MTTRKEQIYEFLKLHAFTSESGGVTTQYLAERLNVRRPNVSNLLNELVEEGLLTKSPGRPVLYKIKTKDATGADTCFDNLIGVHGSLRRAIKIAKAAVIYPQKSLNTLIIGEPGTGKSFIALIMHRYAVAAGIISENAPFIAVDYKDYQDNETRFLEALLDEDGLAAQTGSGFLHVDNAHLMSTGLRNKFCSIAETYQHHDGEPLTKVSPTVIVACNGANQSACEDFSKKIPLAIELPSLAERSLDERMELIQSLFTLEAARAKHTLTISAELLRCLLLYETPINIKQLKGDIKRACAIAYFRERNTLDGNISIFMSDFEPYVRKGFLNYSQHRDEIEHIIPTDYSYVFSETTMQMSAIDQAKLKAGNLYTEIDQKVSALIERGMSEEEITTLLSAECDSSFRNYLQGFSQKVINKEQLQKLVDPSVIDLVEAFLEEVSSQLMETFPASVFYVLCLHVNSIVKDNTSQHPLSNHQMSDLAKKHREKYTLSLQFATKIEKTFNITLAVEEPFLITMILCLEDPWTQPVETPVVLLAFLGKGVASALSELINQLVQQNNTFSFEIPVDHQPTETYKALFDLVTRIDRGKGIIALYDMVQISNYFEMIELETGIKIRGIQLPLTQLGVEWARKAAVADDVNVLYQNMLNTLPQYQNSVSRVIVTLCTTGEGGAEELKRYIRQHGDVQEMKIVPLSMADPEQLRSSLLTLQQRAIIHCVVGPNDPGLFGIPFISVSEILGAKPANLPQVLQFKNREKSRINFDEVFNYLGEQLEYVNIKKLRRYLPKMIEQINQEITPMSLDTEIGLLMHVACSINRILGQESLPKNLRKEQIIKEHNILYRKLLQIIKPFERAFGVIFTDDEMANIVMIIKKL